MYNTVFLRDGRLIILSGQTPGQTPGYRNVQTDGAAMLMLSRSSYDLRAYNYPLSTWHHVPSGSPSRGGNVTVYV